MSLQKVAKLGAKVEIRALDCTVFIHLPISKVCILKSPHLTTVYNHHCIVDRLGIPSTRNSVCFFYFRLLRILCGITLNSAGIPCCIIRKNVWELRDFFHVQNFIKHQCDTSQMFHQSFKFFLLSKTTILKNFLTNTCCATALYLVCPRSSICFYLPLFRILCLKLQHVILLKNIL